ncbi:MAG: protein kinase [Myxococcota bacterium]
MGLIQPSGLGETRAIPFGKYLLLDRIAVGGMAEVFLAKSFGIEGFEKIIAVKRILPTMAEDEDFIEMFIDEAKIAGHLNHANIVPIYELGKIGESHYIAMEYIWGKDLLQIMNRFRKLRKRMPAAMVAFIAGRMCEALDYAHNKRDRSGTPLRLIHRDISPQNILVSYEGAVKLIDFGIAKAASRTTTTQAGVLKGKFGYMSPEQVRGLPIDHRSDVFAVGTCMYEMLTADRLFVGESDFSTLEKVRHASARPPSELIPDLPKEFEDIVMKALARNADDRWSTAGELHEALQRFAVTQRPTFTTSKLAAWMASAFTDEVAKEKARLDGYAAIARPASPVPARATGPKLAAPPPSPDPAALDAFDELEGESTMISASPFEMLQELEAQKANVPDEIEAEPTQIFFSADDLEEIEPTPAPWQPPAPGVGRSSAPVAGRPTAPVDISAGPPPPLVSPSLGPAPNTGAPPSAFDMPPGPPPQLQPLGAVGQLSTVEIARPDGLGAAPTVAPAAQPARIPPRVLIAAVTLLVALLGAVVFALSGSDAGTIEIRTVPNTVAAAVTIDGVARGTTPVRIEGIPTGQRVVRLQAEGYDAWEEPVTVTEGGISTLSVALVAAAAEPEPPAQPQAAQAPAQQPEPEVVVAPSPEAEPAPEPEPEPAPAPTAEDPPVRAPVARRDPPAERPTMREPSTMRVVEREPERTSIMRIERTDGPPAMRASGRGTLVINTIPWAELYVDGRATGRNTPIRNYRIPAGSHRIGLRTQDGTMHNLTVDVPAGETVRIMRRFQ